MQRSLPRAWLARVKSYNLQIVSNVGYAKILQSIPTLFWGRAMTWPKTPWRLTFRSLPWVSKQGRSEYRSNMFGEATRNNLPLSQNEPVPIGDITLAATFASWNCEMLCMMFQYVSALWMWPPGWQDGHRTCKGLVRGRCACMDKCHIVKEGPEEEPLLFCARRMNLPSWRPDDRAETTIMLHNAALNALSWPLKQASLAQREDMTLLWCLRCQLVFALFSDCNLFPLNPDQRPRLLASALREKTLSSKHRSGQLEVGKLGSCGTSRVADDCSVRWSSCRTTPKM